MKAATADYKGMTLLSIEGERKYLTSDERAKFLSALPVLKCPREQTFCKLLFWTGCRPSEALALTALHVNICEGSILVRSLKKRGEQKGRHFRAIPIPDFFADELEAVHGVTALQAHPDGGAGTRLWPMSRTTAWKRIRLVMNAAGLNGIKASAKGLRHAYGIHAALSEVPETRIRTWMGHSHLETTSIYLDMHPAEDKAIAGRMWGT